MQDYRHTVLELFRKNLRARTGPAARLSNLVANEILPNHCFCNDAATIDVFVAGALMVTLGFSTEELTDELVDCDGLFAMQVLSASISLAPKVREELLQRQLVE